MRRTAGTSISPALPLGTEVREAIDALIAAKRLAKESGRGERVPLFDQIIEEEITRAQFADMLSATQMLFDTANAVFIQTLNQSWTEETHR